MAVQCMMYSQMHFLLNTGHVLTYSYVFQQRKCLRNILFSLSSSVQPKHGPLLHHSNFNCLMDFTGSHLIQYMEQNVLAEQGKMQEFLPYSSLPGLVSYLRSNNQVVL